MRIDIPGRQALEIETVACDLNGMLSVDGKLSDRVVDALRTLQSTM